VVPTAAPTVALPRIAQAAPPPAATVILDQQVDEAIAQAIALLEEQKDPNADVAIEKLDRLHRDLDPASTRRPVVEQVMIRALIDDSQRRVRAAFTLKAQDQGRESQRILVDARLRFDRAAQLRPHDATLQERVNQGREQIELISLWVDFDAAYYAKQNDAQIAALTRIMAKNPEYRTAEGPAREKLFAAWISKAQEAWTAKQVDLARVALEEANVVEPDHPLVRQLRASWFPPRSAPVRTAAPARGGGTWSAPAVAAPEAAAAPPSQPGPPPQPSQQLVPQGAYNLEIQTSNESNQSHNSN
jgi:hypothetical protein